MSAIASHDLEEPGKWAGSPAETVRTPGGEANTMEELATPAVASQLGVRNAQLAGLQ